jgi:hypothetical protein
MNDTPTKFPTIRHIPSESSTGHNTLLAWWSPDDKQGPFCGETYCVGDCGLPALILPATEQCEERKARNSYGACCDVFDRRRVTWRGANVEVPEEHRKTCASMIWW